jgi:hypothetical protein
MNIFRSEEHVRNWVSYDPEYDKTLKPLSYWADLFSNQIFRERGRKDYMSWSRSDEAKKARKELVSKLPR